MASDALTLALVAGAVGVSAFADRKAAPIVIRTQPVAADPAVLAAVRTLPVAEILGVRILSSDYPRREGYPEAGYPALVQDSPAWRHYAGQRAALSRARGDYEGGAHGAPKLSLGEWYRWLEVWVRAADAWERVTSALPARERDIRRTVIAETRAALKRLRAVFEGAGSWRGSSSSSSFMSLWCIDFIRDASTAMTRTTVDTIPDLPSPTVSSAASRALSATASIVGNAVGDIAGDAVGLAAHVAVGLVGRVVTSPFGAALLLVVAWKVAT